MTGRSADCVTPNEQHRLDIRAGLEHRAVHEPLAAERACVISDGIAIQHELMDIVRLHKSGAERARQQISARIAGMPQADVSILIKDALSDQDTVCDRKLVSGAA
jgi:hypothetical protein